MANVEQSYQGGPEQQKELLNSDSQLIELNSGYLPFEIPRIVRVATAEASLEPEKAVQPTGQGLPELREAVAKKFYWEYDIKFNPEHVLVTTGSSGALRVVLSRFNGVYNEEEAETKIWAPAVGFDYRKIAATCGIRNIYRYPLDNQGLPDVEQIGDLFQQTEGRNVFLINSPANPTGKVIPNDTMEELAGVFREQDIAVEDNVFAGMIYDGRRHTSMAPYLSKTIVIDSSSKQGANWQVGWLMAPGYLYDDLLDIREATGGVAPPGQYGVAKLLRESDASTEVMKTEMQRKRNLMHERLITIPGFEDIEKPEGGFFYFLSGLPDADVLKQECGVQINNGAKYGLASHRRISFAASDEDIIEGVGRIQEYMAQQ